LLNWSYGLGLFLHPCESAERDALLRVYGGFIATGFEHRTLVRPGFTSRYGVTQLVYYEAYERLMDARFREYKVKRWRREWEIALIEALNPAWQDLYDSLAN
jgi:putative endonuclease